MSLIIHIDRLPEEAVQISEDLERGWLSNIPEYTTENDLCFVKDRIQLSGSLGKEGNTLHLRGKIQSLLHTFCSRCGQEMDYPLDSRFELVLMPGGEKVEGEEEQGLPPDDLSHLYYQGPVLDLAPYFREQFSLDVPLQFLCSPDCKGVCPGCCANLNLESCGCAKESGDLRLRVLRELKLDK